MTIAAGFRFKDGILLCADSQYSYGGVSKAKGDKVMSGKFGRLPIKIGFALAGSVLRAKAAIRNITMHIDGLQSTPSSNDVFQAIEQAQAKSYASVFTHPKYGTPECPDFSLQICLWMNGSGSTLLMTQEDTVTEVKKWSCDGSGAYLFQYILEDAYRPDMELEEILTLVVYAIKEIKGYDPNVGFNSEFLAFFDSRQTFSRMAGYDVNHLENFGLLTKREFFKYMHVVSDLRRTDAELLKAKLIFEKRLLDLRNKYAEDKKEMKNMRDLLGILTTADDGVTFTLPE
jgi:20S proteasome alpha/beta subunit